VKLTPELQAVSDHFRILRDRLLVKRLEYRNKFGLYVAGVELNKGVIVAVGYGRRRRRKVAFKQNMGQGGRAIYFEDGDETGIVTPIGMRVGQVVEFSPRNCTTIDFDRFGFQGAGDLLVIMRNAVMSIDPTESASEASLWQRSAGFDKDGNFLSGAEDWQRA
jgi:co-chaperonin GroES (HSP10)